MYEVGRITITYTAWEDGDLVINHEIDGDLPVVVQVGLLEMTKDTILAEDAVADDDEL